MEEVRSVPVAAGLDDCSVLLGKSCALQPLGKSPGGALRHSPNLGTSEAESQVFLLW